MPEFLTLVPPDDARAILLSNLSGPNSSFEILPSLFALGRIIAGDIQAPHSLPEFCRSTVDGFAVRAQDTYGAGESLPAYLKVIGEVPMGHRPLMELDSYQCALIHTGGMLPNGADAVVMLEHSQTSSKDEVEIGRSVAVGENVIGIGEDIRKGQVVIPRGKRLREAEIGGLMALGIVDVPVVGKPRIGLISTGDEVVNPSTSSLEPGKVRDVNSFTLASLIARTGGEPVLYGIIPDDYSALFTVTQKALTEDDAVVITAGSSASSRDQTVDVIRSLGKPGVLVHGINTRPGKPTILAAVDGKAVIGLPGNPVSALVNGYLFVVPVIEKLLGALPRPRASLTASLAVNLSSLAGREDWFPVRLVRPLSGVNSHYIAEPIFGKSNLIFNMVFADGLIRIPPDSTGLSSGEIVEVVLI